MSIDKKIDYVEQDGSLNFIKNSESVTVPKRFKARKEAPATKLAYITDAEAKMLKKMKKGTPHKGPKGIPSYDSFDAKGDFTSGAAMSAMESGSTNARDRAEVQASNYGAPSGAGPGVKTQAEQDLRSSIIAAGAGQRVNPGFFDSRNVVSPAELAAAKAFNPAAFRAGRRGGIMDFFTGGGFLGNIVRGIGQKFGLGKRFNEPTYDLSKFNELGLLTNRVTPAYYDDFGNEGLLSLTKSVSTDTDDDSEIQEKYGRYLMDAPPNPLTLEQFKNALEGIQKGTLPNTSTSMFPSNNLRVEIQQSDIDLMKTRGGKFLDYDTFKTISGNDSLTEEEHAKLKATV
tara:strand:- start:291 stop:1319 length:1029 start_codon:yes stop_codon:yes gene_type:complete